ncbi:MAG: amidase family protein, partial [Ilumatobacteraceae bacterium]
RFGLIAFASSLDQIGPFTHDVADAAMALQVVAGHDPMDSTSIPEPVPDFTAVLDLGVDGLRVGRITDLPSGADPDVVARLDEAFGALAAAGATIVDVEVPAFTYGLTAYYLIAPAEASSNLARYDGVRYGLRVDGADVEEMMRSTRTAGFGDEVKRRILLGTYALSAGYYDAYYGKALRIRRLMADDFAAAYERCDVLLTPSSPSVAFPFGDKTADPLAMYLCDTYTIPANLTGDPAMSVPFGTGADGLPVGVQVIAPSLGEGVMLRVAAELERRAPIGGAS